MGTGWRQHLEEHQTTADEAVRCVRSGQRVLVGSGCAAPQALLEALVRRSPELADVELVHLLTMGLARYVDERHEGHFRHNAFFIGPNVRGAVGEGRADYTPVFLSEIPDLFYSHRMRLDVAMVMVTPPDRNGYVSLGIHPDVAMAGIETARIVVAQINPNMPRIHGDTFVHVSKLDYIVEHAAPLAELPSSAPDDTSVAIARHIARLVSSGSTLQLGIGTIPNAVVPLLAEHEDLGVHSEMISDGVMSLIEAGAITGTKKTLSPGKVVSSFAMGTQALYDYLHDNPVFEFHPTKYVNDPRIIAQNDRMISINSALQVDITGQVCADSIGRRFYSGIGGQVDFIRGAAMSKGGKPIIALPSTAKGGTISRIVPELDAGAGVVTSRGDVHYVVTEYGVAYLHGKTIRERAMALIEIAHPDFRAELVEAAKERRYVPTVWHLPTEAERYPDNMESTTEFRGAKRHVRPLRAADAEKLMDFFYSHRPETVHGRYQYPKNLMTLEEALQLCTLDYSKRFALAVFADENDAEILAVGRYTLNESTSFAETAVVVHEEYRRVGIATYLMERLKDHAIRNGVKGFFGRFDPESRGSVKLNRRLGHGFRFDQGEGYFEVDFDLLPEAEQVRV